MLRTPLVLPSLLLVVCLLPVKGQATAAGVPVPKPTATGQSITSSPTAPFTWTPVTLPYGLNGTGQMAVGGTVDATTRLSVNPQGTSENGLTVNMPSAYNGFPINIKDSTGISLFAITPGYAPGHQAGITVGGSPFLSQSGGGWVINTYPLVVPNNIVFGDSGTLQSGGGGGTPHFYIDCRSNTAYTQGPIVIGDVTTSLLTGAAQSYHVVELAQNTVVRTGKTFTAPTVNATTTFQANGTPGVTTTLADGSAVTGGIVTAPGTAIVGNGSQVAVGGTVDATTRLSVNPQGTSENGLTVNLPSGASGYGMSVKDSTGNSFLNIYTKSGSPVIRTQSYNYQNALETYNRYGGLGVSIGAFGDMSVAGTLTAGSYAASSIRDAASHQYINVTDSSPSWTLAIGTNNSFPPYTKQVYVLGAPSTSLATSGIDLALPVTARAGLTNAGYHSVTALATPTAPGFNTSTTGGTLAPGTYYYQVVAVSGTGTTLASAEASKVVPAGTSTNTVTPIWLLVPGAQSYNVYGRTTGAELLIASGITTTYYVDTGSITPAGALPTVNTTGYITAPFVNATTAFQANGTPGLTTTLTDGSAVTGGIVAGAPSTILGNGSQVAVGGTVDATTRFSVNPQGTAENGLTVNMPSGATGNALQVKNSTNAVVASIDPAGNINTTATATITSSSFALNASSGDVMKIKTFGSSTYQTLINKFGNIYTNCISTTQGLRLGDYSSTYSFVNSQALGKMDISRNGQPGTYCSIGAVAGGGTLEGVSFGAVSYFGSSDTNLYRASSGLLQTDGGLTGLGNATFPAVLTAISTKTSAYTLTATDTTILMNGAFAVTLPVASATLAGHSWTVKQIGAASSTVVGTIDGNTAGYTLAAQYSFVTIVTDGVSYYIVGNG